MVNTDGGSEASAPPSTGALEDGLMENDAKDSVVAVEAVPLFENLNCVKQERPAPWEAPPVEREPPWEHRGRRRSTNSSSRASQRSGSADNGFRGLAGDLEVANAVCERLEAYLRTMEDRLVHRMREDRCDTPSRDRLLSPTSPGGFHLGSEIGTSSVPSWRGGLGGDPQHSSSHGSTELRAMAVWDEAQLGEEDSHHTRPPSRRPRLSEGSVPLGSRDSTHSHRDSHRENHKDERGGAPNSPTTKKVGWRTSSTATASSDGPSTSLSIKGLRHAVDRTTSNDGFQSKITAEDNDSVWGETNSHHRFAWLAVRPTLSPDNPFRLAWDLLSVVALFYDSVTVPFVLAWDPVLEGILLTGMWITPSFWTIDMLLNFCTGYYNKAEMEMRPRAVVVHYLRTWFPLDVTLNISDWTSVLIETLLKSSVTDATGFARLFKINRAVRLLSMSRVGRKWSKIEQLTTARNTDSVHIITQVLKLFVSILWLNHLICCIWYAIGKHMPADTQMSWLDSIADSGVVGMTPGELKSFYDYNSLYQYTTSFHWAMTQMTPGSMEITPKNSAERFFNIFILAVGLLVGASLVSQLSAQMVQLQMQKQAQMKQMRTLHRFLRQNKVSSVLYTRCIHQARLIVMRPQQLTSDDVQCWPLLSASLRAELQHEIYHPNLLTCPMFFLWGRISSTAIRDVCATMSRIGLGIGEELFTSKTKMEKVYILTQGGMRYYLGSSKEKEPQRPALPSPTRQLRAKAPGGLQPPPEDAPVEEEKTTGVEDIEAVHWIGKAALWTEWTSVGTIEAQTQCELVCIPVARMFRAIRKHHRVHRFLAEYRAAFDEFLPDRRGVNDLRTGLELGDVVMHLSLETRLDMMSAVMTVLKQRGWLLTLSLSFRLDAELETEVRSGKSAVILNPELSPEMVALVVAFRMMRQDGRLLTEVGKVEKGMLLPQCQLPGIKVKDGELPQMAAQRLLSGKMAWFAGDVELGPGERSTVSKKSATFGLNTTYWRTTYTIYLPSTRFPISAAEITAVAQTPSDRPSVDEDGLVVKTMTTLDGGADSGYKVKPVYVPPVGRSIRLRKRGSGLRTVGFGDEPTPMTRGTSGGEASQESGIGGSPGYGEKVFLVSKAQGNVPVNLYAWLSPEEFDHLSCDEGSQDLHRWIQSCAVAAGMKGSVS